MPFAEEFDKMQKRAYNTACSKGWWDDPRRPAELIALMHSELSEALEYIRINNPADDKILNFSGVEAELADVIIRIMDMAGRYGYRIGDAIEAKMLYNEGRSYKHGNKVL